MKCRKLVRHKIPTVIRESGRIPVVRRANDNELPYLLMAKFIEEINEFFQNPCAEEAADIYEVLHTLCMCHKISMNDVHEEVNRKYDEKGGFFAGIILENIREDNE